MAFNISDSASKYYGSTILTVLIIVICLILFAKSWKKHQTIADIKVYGAKYLTVQEIIAYTGIKDSLGVSLNRASLTKIEQNVAQHEFVSKVQAWREGLHSIAIEIRERIPFAVVCPNEGHLQYIDSSGKVLPYRLFAAITNVPIIYGSLSKDSIAKIRDGVYTLKQILTVSGEELFRQIGSIEWSYPQRCWVVYLDTYNILLLISPEREIALQINKLNAMLHENSTIANKQIDLRWQDKVVVSDQKKNK